MVCVLSYILTPVSNTQEHPDSGKGDADGKQPQNGGGKPDDPLNKSAKFSNSLEAAAQSIKKWSASKTLTEGLPPLDAQSPVKSIELNENPRIGPGKGAAMKLLVQMAHLTAGQHLLRLHLAKNQIEDEGVGVLTDAFTTDGFAPRLQILWLSENCITDIGAGLLRQAIKASLECLAEISLFR